MIYSREINKVCAVCAYASEAAGGSETHCSIKKQTVSVSDSCPKFKYDILKRTVHRQRRLKTDFSAEDFKI